ncbi:MAG: lactoylglutathione lyase [Clostridiales bacterium]|nr:lactoylglutathione lyase [Clostridiales bacterium]
MPVFNHCSINVLNLERSLKFYEEALGMKPVRRMDAPDGSYSLVFLGDGSTDFSLELTWLRDRTKPYDLGECEFHYGFVADNFEELRSKHREMGVICFENEKLGVYFIEDPDGYWLELIPRFKK